MTYEGPPTIFRFDEVEKDIGALSSSYVQRGRLVYFLAPDGFRVTDGVTTRRIGRLKVDDWFFGQVNGAFYYRMSAAFDPVTGLCSWAYPGPSTFGGQPTQIIVYDPESGRWSHVEQVADLIFNAVSTGYTLDGLDSVSTDIDALSASLDSSVWQGGVPNIAGFNNAHRLAFFSGTTKQAIIDTAEIQPFGSNGTYCWGARPLVNEYTSCDIEVSTRKLQSDTSFNAVKATANSTTGFANLRTTGRYMRCQVTINGDFSHAQGVELHLKDGGFR
jgi:hypothetical protein